MPPGNGAIPTSAFLSYAHDSPQHRDAVRRLWFLLIENGVNAWADLAAEDQRQEWPRRMEEKLDASDYILVIASEAYRRRVNRPAGETQGRGVEYEAALIRERLYDNREFWYPRILPVVLPGHDHTEIPSFLGPRGGTNYRVTSFTVAGAEPLLRILTGQPAEGAPALGTPPSLPRRPAPMDSRTRTLDDLVDVLLTLPATQSAPARATFAEMIQARLEGPIDADAGQDPAHFLRDMIISLARLRRLDVVVDVVRALHRSQPVEQDIRHLVERWEMSG
jgi:hypothetical protein